MQVIWLEGAGFIKPIWTYFNELNDSYMIMIACFDLFGFGKYKRVCSIKRNEEVGVRYLQQWEEKIMIREKAMEQGEKKKAIDIAKNLIDLLDVEVIATKTGLSVEEVQRIKTGLTMQSEELKDDVSQK